MTTYLTIENWKSQVNGWLITDCAIRNRDIAYFCLRKETPAEEASLLLDHDIHTRFLAI
jgi:hypothetical protein